MSEAQASDQQTPAWVDRPGRLQDLADRIDRRGADGRPLAGRDPRLGRAVVYALVGLASAWLLVHAWSASVEAVGAEQAEPPGLFPLYGYVAGAGALMLSKLYGLIFGRRAAEQEVGDAR